MKDELIIQSILDNDLYKFTMQQGVLELFPGTNVSYRFKNRGIHRFNNDFLSALKRQIGKMGLLSLSTEEYSWIQSNIPFFKPAYLEYLKNYRFDPTEVEASLDAEDNLVLDIKGTWESTILWEVPLMALISELYFKMIDTNWNSDGQTDLAFHKMYKLSKHYCYTADFATRRRRSFDNQDRVVNEMKEFAENKWGNTFVGVSNVYLAKKHGLRPIGTMAHEWFMGISVLEGLRNANYYAITNWKRVYTGTLGIALTDTYGTEAFFNNFTLELSKLYDGVRHDSGDPFEFGDKVIAHYQKMGIDPLTKTIVFSDGLNVDKAIEIKKYFQTKIKVSFGIGTHFSNDFKDSPALNMVIKLWSVWHNGVEVPVVKLSDNPIKVMGDPGAVMVAKWTFCGAPIFGPAH